MSQLEAEYITLNHISKLALKAMQKGQFDTFNKLMVQVEEVKERIVKLEGEKE